MNRLDAVPGFRLILALMLPMGGLLTATATVRRAPAVPEEFVYAVRASMGPHWYENFGY